MLDTVAAMAARYLPACSGTWSTAAPVPGRHLIPPEYRPARRATFFPAGIVLSADAKEAPGCFRSSVS